MAQERKYTAKAFGLAVEAYFRRITRTKRLVVAEPDGEEKNGVFTAKTDMVQWRNGIRKLLGNR